MPWVILKSAMTLDGKIATQSGDSKWITSPLSRLAVHRQLRDRCDAILTGVGTVIRDDPSLTTRLTHREGRSPLRIVADTHCRVPIHSKIVQQSTIDGGTLVATAQSTDNKNYRELASLGCRMMTCDLDSEGRLSLKGLLQQLGTQGDVIGVLVESGGELAASLLREKLVDRWVAWVAPKIAGGSDSPGPVGGSGVMLMADAEPISIRKLRRCGVDYVFDARIG
jgi:diaminohydroxyphosphoribosylaminopyrimidine deaminase / 5-amino-6-(5-phosphoribosylamino)uracil reductase